MYGGFYSLPCGNFEMKILDLDVKKGNVKVAVENVDDLWHLYNLLVKGDAVRARTSRAIKGASEGSRPSEGRRVAMTLKLRVEEIAFDKNLSRLRLRGIVLGAPERYDGIKGSYHTITVAPNDQLRFFKNRLTRYEVRRLKSASEIKAPPVVIIALDDEEAAVGVLGRFGVEVKFEKKNKLPSKREADRREDAFNRYFSELAHVLQEVWRPEMRQLAVVGPGFVKEGFVRYLRENLKLKPEPALHVQFASSGGSSGLNEALRSGVLLKVIRESRVLEEVALVEKFLAALASGRRDVAYGIDEVEAADRFGAVDRLMVVDRRLREVEDEERLRLESVIRGVEDKRGRITIISSEHEGGEKIMSFGGVAAMLRFPIS
jgi:protein pelota